MVVKYPATKAYFGLAGDSIVNINFNLELTAFVEVLAFTFLFYVITDKES